ncbi:MAG: cellulase family glycosylhydrolase [Acidobacteriota bacterium]
MKILILLFSLIFILTGSFYGEEVDFDATITINPNKVKHKMAGGIGASWHAISKEKIDEDKSYKWALRYINSRGSSWGGNPPVSDTAAWDQILGHAEWLGLNWIRVEISQRMYEPEKGKFDWDNEEMSALYKILDWCEEHKADVFLQQMWRNVKWNSYPEVQPLLSAPRSLKHFSRGLAKLIQYLKIKKGYSCIKWLCITNEPPGGTWGSWWSMGEKDAPLTPALKAVRKALDKKKISLPISGPDWTDTPKLDPDKIDFDKYLGAYDIHSYSGIDEDKQKILKDWVKWAKDHNKPFFLSEVGNMEFGWRNSDPGPTLYNTAISNVESILRGMDEGVDSFNRWSFTNRGDLDGQWQLIRTWDMNKKEYLKNVEPEPVPYYGFGIISRFFAKYSEILQTTTSGDPDIMTQTVRSPGGQLTVYILNKSNKIKNIEIRLEESNKIDLYLYLITESGIRKGNFKLDPVEKITFSDAPVKNVKVPAKAVCTLSQYNLEHEDKGIISQ